jgi:hypothetical protein
MCHLCECASGSVVKHLELFHDHGRQFDSIDALIEVSVCFYRFAVCSFVRFITYDTDDTLIYENCYKPKPKVYNLHYKTTYHNNLL